MAAKNEHEAIAHTFQWKIESVSQCWWIEKLERISSPTFTIEDEEGSTKWSLWLYLKGCKEGEMVVDEIVAKLHRESDCSGPESVVVKYELSFLDKNGIMCVNEETNVGCFTAGQTSVSEILDEQEKVFVTFREEFLREDILTVQCTLQKIKKESYEGKEIKREFYKGKQTKKEFIKKEDLAKSEYSYARTVFNVIRKSFDWRIDNFSTITLQARKKLINELIEFELLLNLDVVKALDVNMISFQECIKYLSFDISMVDSEGRKKSCGVKRYFDSHIRIGVHSPMLIFPTHFFENKHRFLANDVLPLDFGLVIATVKHSDWRKYFSKGNGQATQENMAVLSENFRSLYNNSLFSDVVLLTNDHAFPAHKAILSARSPVFSRIFTNTAEHGHVDMHDLDYDTAHQMLLFVYSGVLEDLRLESASKLYTAAIKYEILTLKETCSSFLKQGLCPENACHVFAFAHRHEDDDLINDVKDYMLDNNEVFKSLEWKPFMQDNLELAADILYWKVTHD